MISAVQFNRWRVIPRMMLILYGYVFQSVIHWFMELEDPNVAQATFVSTVVGAAAVFFGLYVNSGASLRELSDAGGPRSDGSYKE